MAIALKSGKHTSARVDAGAIHAIPGTAKCPCPMAHEEPPAGLVHALEAVELREPLSPYSRFQISCIGLGLALIGYGLSLQGGYWAPLAGASLIFLPCMLVATAITGLLALNFAGSTTLIAAVP